MSVMLVTTVTERLTLTEAGWQCNWGNVDKNLVIRKVGFSGSSV